MSKRIRESDVALRSLSSKGVNRYVQFMNGNEFSIPARPQRPVGAKGLTKCNCRALNCSCRTAPELLFAFRENSATERIGRFPEFLIKANVCVRERLPS